MRKQEEEENRIRKQKEEEQRIQEMAMKDLEERLGHNATQGTFQVHSLPEIETTTFKWEIQSPKMYLIFKWWNQINYELVNA